MHTNKEMLREQHYRGSSHTSAKPALMSALMKCLYGDTQHGEQRGAIRGLHAVARLQSH